LVVQDWLWRLGYRLGFRAARLWWRLRRPAHDGAVVAVWWDGRVLAVQQSYRKNPSWPGGGIRRGEEAREARLVAPVDPGRRARHGEAAEPGGPRRLRDPRPEQQRVGGPERAP
jgi:hypothetical protein